MDGTLVMSAPSNLDQSRCRGAPDGSSAVLAALPGASCQGGAVASIQPELWVNSGAAAITFYVNAFGARVLHQVGVGADIVAQLDVDGACFWISTAAADGGRFSPAAIGGSTSRTLLVVDEPEAFVRRAIRAGALEVSPVQEEHGWRLGRISDPFGQEWEIGRPIAAWPPMTPGQPI